MKTYDDIRNLLSAIEPTEEMYSGLTADDLPQLQSMMSEAEPWLAARAVFAASRLPTSAAHAFLIKASTDHRPQVRVALAASVGQTQHPVADEVLLRLLDDGDMGVKKFAIGAIGSHSSTQLKEKLSSLASQTQDSYIRQLAREKSKLLP